jgi:hypothetical protein
MIHGLLRLLIIEAEKGLEIVTNNFEKMSSCNCHWRKGFKDPMGHGYGKIELVSHIQNTDQLQGLEIFD